MPHFHNYLNIALLHQQAPFGSAQGFQQLPQHVIAATARPYTSVPTSPHLLQKTVGQKVPHGHTYACDHSGPTTPVGFEDEHAPLPLHPPPSMQKRWSVPSFMYTPQPAFQPSLAQQPETQCWSSGYVHGRHSVVEPNPRKPHASDPWTHCDSSTSVASLRHPSSSHARDFKSPRPHPPLARSMTEPWLQPPTPTHLDGAGDLQQLMKTLDIAEHLHVLKVSCVCVCVCR